MPCQLTKFASDRSGNFAILTVLLAVPLVLAVGLAIDASDLSETGSHFLLTLTFGPML